MPFFVFGQTSYKKGMVVTAHPEASKIGLSILQLGGNAVDASIAVQLALAVCYPNAGNLGGGGFMVYRSSIGEVNALDFRETASLQAHQNMYLDSVGNVIPNLSREDVLSIGIPGTVDGLFKAYKKYGSLPFDSLINPSIQLAFNGFPLSDRQAKELNKLQDRFKKYNRNNKYFQSETGFMGGDTLKQTDLGRVLLLIKEKGREGFYDGVVGESMVQTISNRGGMINLIDLRKYESKWRKPIITNYKGYEIVSMPPPSSGGVVLGMMLNMLSDYDFSELKWNSAKYIHLLSEVERRAYADRNQYLGDPDFVQNPLDKMLDTLYAVKRMKNFSWEKASNSGNIGPGEFVYPLVKRKESEETTHFSIVDQFGNAVSVTTTLNSSYGSKVVVDGCGFIMNNEMDDFTSKVGEANIYGLVQGEKNIIEANKRMLSSMTPAIVSKEGDLKLIVGSPGGSTIITSVLQNILNIVEFDMDMQQSVDAPRFHHQWLPDQIFVEENRFPSETISELEKLGHTVKSRSPIGRVDAIKVVKKKYQGGADSRGDDTVEGF